MSKKHFFVILLVLTLITTLIACERPASEGPTGETGEDETQATNPPVPGVESPEQDMGDTMATQTALAMLPPAMTATPPPPQPTATNPPPPPTAGRPETYKLQKGEFPYCIARRFNISPNDLLSLNGLTTASRTYVGQELKIPQSGSFPYERSLHAHPTSYTAQSNDTIYTIACYFGDVDPMLIAHQNGLSEPYTLSAGQVLNIP